MRHPQIPRPHGAGRQVARYAAVALAASLLAGCGGGGGYAAAPTCPRAVPLPDAGEMTQFRGRGTDLSDMVIDARITGLKGTCSPDEGGRLKVEVRLSLVVTRGPAAAARSDAVDYFIAVTEGDHILVKDPLRQAVEFPPNVDRVALTTEALLLSLPTTRTKTGAAFTIIAGFQLTPAQLAFNRQHRGH